MRLPLVLAVAAAVAITAPGAADDGATDAEAVVLDMIRAINARDWDALAGCVADDVRRHCAATPDLDVRSRDDFEAFLRRDLEAFPDAVQEVDYIFSAGDRVGLRALYRGTQTGAFGPFPASGRTLELPFVALLRVADGKVAEIWVEWDNLNALSQLGHWPPHAAGADPASVEARVVPSACGQCQFGMEGEGCTLAVRIGEESLFVEGTGIDDHGDAHAADGFCQTVRRAEVTGRVEGGKFVATAFRLLPAAP